MDAPPGRALSPVDVFRSDQDRKNVTHSVHEVAPDSPVIVIFNKTFQGPATDTL